MQTPTMPNIDSDSGPAHQKEHMASRLGLATFRFLLAQWLILGFALACVLAYFFPSVAAPGGVIRSQDSILYGAVAIIFFISGLQLAPAKLKKHSSNWRLHATVQGICFIVAPIIVLVIIHICVAAGAMRSGTPSVPVMLGMITTSCLPTTIASNIIMTAASGGDESAAVVSVAVGNVAGAFLSPILIYGFIPHSAVFNSWRPATPKTLGRMYADVAKQLSLSVVLPLAVGQGVRWWRDEMTAHVLKKLQLSKAPGICLILLVWTTFSGAFKTGAIFKLSKSSVVFNIFMNIALYLVLTCICFYAARPPKVLITVFNSYLTESRLAKSLPTIVKRKLSIEQMPREQAIAVCFCGAAKTTSLGIPLVTAMWKTDDNLTRAYIQVPVLLYTIEQVLVAQILTYFFRWYMRRGTKRGPGFEHANEVELNTSVINTPSLDGATLNAEGCT